MFGEPVGRAPRIVVFLSAFALSILGVGRAALASNPAERVLPIVFAPELLSGDDAALLDRCLEILAQSPNDPSLEYVLLRARSLAATREDRERILESIRSILERKTREALRPFHQSMLVREAYSLRERLGLDADADRAAWNASFLTNWRAIGPLGVRSADCLDWPFEIESTLVRGAIEPGREFATPWGKRSLLPMRRFERGTAIDVSGVIDLEYGAAYAVTAVELDSDQPLMLEVSCGDSFRMWWNGAVAAQADRIRGDEAVQFRVVVPGVAGWNRIVIKLAGVGTPDFSVRVHDGDGRAMHVASQGTDLDRALASNVIAGSPFPRPFEDLLRACVRWREAAAAGEPRDAAPQARAAPHVLEAFMRLSRGEVRESLACYERAIAVFPESPQLFRGLARALGRANHLPETWQRNQARTIYRRIVELAPDCVPARLWLAIDRHRQGDTPAAFEALVEVARLAPNDAEVQQLLAALCAANDWDHERSVHLEHALELAPGDPDVLLDVAEWHEQEGRKRRAVELLERCLDADDEQPGVMQRLTRLELELGDVGSALARVRQYFEERPYDANAHLTYARFLEELDRHDEAVAVLSDAIEAFPANRRFLEALGEICEARGDTEAAIAWYTRLVESRPEAHAAREALVRLGAMPRDAYFDEFRLATAPILEAAAARDYRAEFPRAASVALLDDLILRFYPDGSSRLITHQIFLVLNDEGIEQHGTMRPRGTLLELHTILPDGTRLEPISLGTGEYTMPGLTVGSCVEWRYEERLPSMTGSPVRMAPYYFQDVGMTMPFLRSRYVVIEPKGLRLEHMRLNYDDEPRVFERGDDRITIYDVIGLGQLKPEPGMPDPVENVPQVVLVEPRGWKEIHQEILLRGKVAVTNEVARAARQWIEGVNGQAAQARVLYDRVNDWVRVSSNASPTQTLLERRGSRMPLYMTMLEAVGIEYDFAQARRSPELDLEDPKWHWLRSGLFPNSLIRVRPNDGPATWVLMGPRNQRYGDLPANLHGGPVFIADGGEGTLEYLPLAPAEEDILTRSEVDIYPEGFGYEGTIRLQFPNGIGAFLKERVAQMTDAETEVVKQNIVRGYLPGSRLIDGGFENVESREAPLVFTGKVTVDGEAAPDERNMLAFRLSFAPMDLVQALSTPGEREHPLLFENFDHRSDRMRIHLGDAYRVVTVPAGIDVDRFLGRYRFAARRLGTTLELRREVRFGPTRIAPEDYPEFMRICREIDDREADRVWLVPTAALPSEDGDDEKERETDGSREGAR